MAKDNRRDIKVTTGQLTPEQAKRLRQMSKEKSTKSNLEFDLKNKVVTPELFVKTVLNPKNTSFINAKDYRNILIRVKMHDGSMRDYYLTEVIGMMKKYIEVDVLEPLSNIRLAYLRKYDPKFRYPEGTGQDIIDAIDEVDKKIERLLERRIQQGEFVVNSKEEKDKCRKLSYERAITEAFLDAVYVLHSYKKSFSKIPSKEVVEEVITKYSDTLINFCVKSVRECKWVQEDIDYACIGMLFRKFSNRMSPLSGVLDLGDLSDDEVIQYMENFITRGEFERFLTVCGDCIIDRKKVIRFITAATPEHDHSKAGIVSQEELKQKVDKERVYSLFGYTKDKDLLQYMNIDQVLGLYLEGSINDRDLRKHLTLGDILEADIDTKKKIEIILDSGTSKPFSGKESEKIWLMFERGEITTRDITRLEIDGYFSIDDIIRLYTENSKRVIANELGEAPSISEEKLLEYFTPDMILRASRNNKDEELSEFYKSIKDVYAKHGANLDTEMATMLKARSGLNEKALATEGFLLYRDGITSINILRELETPTELIVDYCINHKNEHQLLIDVFNAGLVDELTMFEEILDTDFDLACELIQKGMSARIIQGFESTKSLIEMTRSTVDENGNEVSPKLTYKNLAEIKDDIIVGLEDEKRRPKTATLLSMYLNDELTYAELYGLAQEGVISIDIANEINEKYNIIKDWEALKEKGVEGSPIEGLYDNPDPGPTPIIPYAKGAVGIDEDCIIDYYIALGAKEYLEIDHKKCPVFKDYIVIPIIDKKVAYLEGKDGRTYIVPLKIVLEQINNPNGEMDLIGNAQSRNAFNNQKKHIRSANHTRNWGRKVAMKTADLPSVPMDKEEAKQFIADNMDIIKAIEHSYDARRLAAIKQNNAQQIP